MQSRTRLALWAIAVASTMLSPVLYRLVAPWLGALWQCVCLAGIVALYATTPANAMRLPAHASRAIILLGTALIPGLCFGLVTVPLVLLPLLLLAFDHVRIARAAPKRVTLSRDPGPLADWFSTVLLWSPAMWEMLGGPEAASHPVRASISIVPALLIWLVAVQTSILTRERPWPRRRLLVVGSVLVAVAAAMVWMAARG